MAMGRQQKFFWKCAIPGLCGSFAVVQWETGFGFEGMALTIVLTLSLVFLGYCVGRKWLKELDDLERREGKCPPSEE